MDSPGTWEILRLTSRQIASGTGLERDQARRISPPPGSERGEDRLERRSENISDAVFSAGSRSALIVLMTLGNAAQADPAEGSGAS